MKKSAAFTNKIIKITGKAINDYKMIVNRDRVLVCVSGADSLALLDILEKRLRFIPIEYKMIAVHINQNAKNAKVIENYLKEKGVEYYILKLDLKEGRKDNVSKSPCFWCSWKRREMLFKFAKKVNCNKIVFGHHIDDIIETQLLNLFFHGEISTMPPKLKMFKGNFHIVRPLAYLEKKDIKKYAQITKIPSMPYVCPFGKRTNRVFVRQLILDVQKRSPYVKKNLFRSMKDIRKKYLP